MSGPALNLQQKLHQGPVMTPDLQQAIQMLTMPLTDLHLYVQNELLENPFLQSADDTAADTIGTAAEDLELSVGREEFAQNTNDLLAKQTLDAPLALDHNWEDVYDGGDAPLPKTYTANTEETQTWENTASAEITLSQHLMAQLRVLVQNPIDLFLGQFIIDAIDDAGYLRLDVAGTANQLNIHPGRLEDMIAIVQTCDPVGIAATDLRSCLRMQLHRADNLTDAAEIVLDNLNLLAKRDWAKLAKLAGGDLPGVQDAAADIAKCNPKPGLGFGTGGNTAIIPDVIVQEQDGILQVDLNAAAMPTVLLNKTAQTIFTGANKSAQQYIQNRVSRANWLVKSLEQRARTILKVSRAIVQEQGDFFTYGVESLKPLTLKQVADLAQVHESTVSRVTTGKYLATPLGTFELKHFFSAGIGTTGGQVEVAASSVKVMLKRVLSQEDARKPLSDEKLVQLLENEGIAIARRTVAKYREALGILASSQRRIR